jgi:hypothetical protein
MDFEALRTALAGWDTGGPNSDLTLNTVQDLLKRSTSAAGINLPDAQLQQLSRNTLQVLDVLVYSLRHHDEEEPAEEEEAASFKDAVQQQLSIGECLVLFRWP